MNLLQLSKKIICGESIMIRDSGTILLPFLIVMSACTVASSFLHFNTAISLAVLALGMCNIDNLVPSRQHIAYLRETRLTRIDLHVSGGAYYGEFWRCLAAFARLGMFGVVWPLVADVLSRLVLVAAAVFGPDTMSASALYAIRKWHYLVSTVSPFWGAVLSVGAASIALLVLLVFGVAQLHNVCQESRMVHESRAQARKNGACAPQKPTLGDLQMLFSGLSQRACCNGELRPFQCRRFEQKRQRCGAAADEADSARYPDWCFADVWDRGQRYQPGCGGWNRCARNAAAAQQAEEAVQQQQQKAEEAMQQEARCARAIPRCYAPEPVPRCYVPEPVPRRCAPKLAPEPVPRCYVPDPLPQSYCPEQQKENGQRWYTRAVPRCASVVPPSRPLNVEAPRYVPQCVRGQWVREERQENSIANSLGAKQCDLLDKGLCCDAADGDACTRAMGKRQPPLPESPSSENVVDADADIVDANADVVDADAEMNGIHVYVSDAQIDCLCGGDEQLRDEEHGEERREEQQQEKEEGEPQKEEKEQQENNEEDSPSDAEQFLQQAKEFIARRDATQDASEFLSAMRQVDTVPDQPQQKKRAKKEQKNE